MNNKSDNSAERQALIAELGPGHSDIHRSMALPYLRYCVARHRELDRLKAAGRPLSLWRDFGREQSRATPPRDRVAARRAESRTPASQPRTSTTERKQQMAQPTDEHSYDRFVRELEHKTTHAKTADERHNARMALSSLRSRLPPEERRALQVRTGLRSGVVEGVRVEAGGVKLVLGSVVRAVPPAPSSTLVRSAPPERGTATPRQASNSLSPARRAQRARMGIEDLDDDARIHSDPYRLTLR